MNGPYIFINIIKVEMRLDMICLVPFELPSYKIICIPFRSAWSPRGSASPRSGRIFFGYFCSFWCNGRGEPAVSYKWTGWIWEITSWSSRPLENFRGFYGIYPKLIKENRKMSTGNWLDWGEHYDIDWPCPKISLDIVLVLLSWPSTSFKNIEH